MSPDQEEEQKNATAVDGRRVAGIVCGLLRRGFHPVHLGSHLRQLRDAIASCRLFNPQFLGNLSADRLVSKLVHSSPCDGATT